MQTIQASAKGKERMPASYSIDIWSLGAIAYNIFARQEAIRTSLL